MSDAVHESPGELLRHICTNLSAQHYVRVSMRQTQRSRHLERGGEIQMQHDVSHTQSSGQSLERKQNFAKRLVELETDHHRRTTRERGSNRENQKRTKRLDGS